MKETFEEGEQARRTNLGIHTLEVSGAKRSSQGLRYREVLRGSDPDDAVYESVIIRNSKDVLLVEQVTRFGDHVERCDLAPAVIMRPAVLKVGSRWETVTACGDLPLRFAGHVARRQQIQIAGSRIDASIIETIIEMGTGEERFVVERTEWFSARHAIAVKIVEDQMDIVRTVTTKTLRSLRPS